MLQNSKTQILKKTQTLKLQQNSKTWIVTKLKLWQNSKNQIVEKLKNSNGAKIQKNSKVTQKL